MRNWSHLPNYRHLWTRWWIRFERTIPPLSRNICQFVTLFLVLSSWNKFKSTTIEFGALNAHLEAPNASFCLGHEWAKGILVETLELIQCFEGSNKISKTWIFRWNFWKVVSQGNFLVSGKCLPIQGSELFVFEMITNWHSTYCN